MQNPHHIMISEALIMGSLLYRVILFLFVIVTKVRYVYTLSMRSENTLYLVDVGTQTNFVDDNAYTQMQTYQFVPRFTTTGIVFSCLRCSCLHGLSRDTTVKMLFFHA